MQIIEITVGQGVHLTVNGQRVFVGIRPIERSAEQLGVEAKIGIEAPKHISVDREEIHRKKRPARAAKQWGRQLRR